MSLHFVPLTILDIRHETPDCVSIAFLVPPDQQQQFQFIQGQNITIRASLDGQEIRRSYSICSATYEPELRVAVKKAPYGLFSTYANEKLKPGDVLEVLPPTGKFNVPLDPAHHKNYLAFAAGSGITPVISIIKTTLRTELHSNFTLVYGNRSRASIIFFEELEGLKNTYMDRFQLIHILSRERTDSPINFGRIGPEKCKALADKLIRFSQTDEIFICGPEEMTFSVRDWLYQQGISRKKIHFELFTTPGEKKGDGDQQTKKDGKAHKATITIKQDGRSFDLELSFEGNSILDAALQQGADLPFACKGGVCGTCRARLLEGEVDMDVNWALEPDEVEQGFILSCQSHPKTDKVVVDYDIR